MYYAMVTREMKLFWNNLKLFQCFISHVTTSETEIKFFSAAEGVLELFHNYFSDSEHVVENIYELQ